MDIERNSRREIVEALGHDFTCFEEINLRHATFTGNAVRADVVAFPNDPNFEECALAFEVKVPDQRWKFVEWSRAAHQATDYVFACVDDKRTPQFNGFRVRGSFLYPSPPYTPYGKDQHTSEFLRPSNEEMMAGVLHLAMHFRVGHCQRVSDTHGKLRLNLGPNSIWEQGHGFTQQAYNLLKGKRLLGSRKIDFARELDEQANQPRR